MKENDSRAAEELFPDISRCPRISARRNTTGFSAIKTSPF